MDYPITPFDSVESTLEYFRLLSETLLEVRREIEGDIAAETESTLSRRLEALRLILFKLQKLEDHVKTGSRLLNDLRKLRRLLLTRKNRKCGRKAGSNLCFDGSVSDCSNRF